MEYDVTAGQMSIDFGATGDKEILQNVANILSSVIHSCPMHREFAFDASVLDKPMNLVQTLIKSRIFSSIKKFEPRAQVTKVSFQGSGSDGVLRPIVRVRING